mmetsp:Transcript_32695/g.107200  ORF Transcript_32695/g.107200 Transcript_32695/m.107200 type:complete len:230 (-) Transcript_32695:14-703(-)
MAARISSDDAPSAFIFSPSSTAASCFSSPFALKTSFARATMSALPRPAARMPSTSWASCAVAWLVAYLASFSGAFSAAGVRGGGGAAGFGALALKRPEKGARSRALTLKKKGLMTCWKNFAATRRTDISSWKCCWNACAIAADCSHLRFSGSGSSRSMAASFSETAARMGAGRWSLTTACRSTRRLIASNASSKTSWGAFRSRSWEKDARSSGDMRAPTRFVSASRARQ